MVEEQQEGGVFCPPPRKIGLRAIFCKSHPTCDSRVFRISSYFSQLKIKVILEYGRNFSFIKYFVEFLGGGESRDNSSFSRNANSVHSPQAIF